MLIVDVFSFTFEAKRKRKKTTNEKLAQSVSYLQKFNRLPKIPKIPDARPKKPQTGEAGSGYDPCKITQLCQNNGTCVAKNGNYFCQCPTIFYGKTCEFLADQSSCADNKCQNDATCYRCWCRPGFSGSLCEHSEEMRECEEDYCLHKGVGRMVNTTDGQKRCKCQCENHHTGERCETSLPCKHFVCMNGGICENHLVGSDDDGQHYTAVCKCPPRSIRGIAATFEGKRCEQLNVLDELRTYDDCFPCRKKAKDYLNTCIDPLTQVSEGKRLKDILDVCGSACDRAFRFCLNGGVCDVQGFLSDDQNSSYLFPVCQCLGLDEGMLCEKHISSPCDATSFDPRPAHEKCGSHGSCVGKTLSDYSCDCLPGWTGEKCDVEEPCFKHQCSSGSLCVAVPIEHREQYSLGYTCLCEMNQEPDFSSSDTVKCLHANFGLCKNHLCKNHGQCYPCDKSDLENLQLCNEEEKGRGFRCLCPNGLLQPFCDREADACYKSKCQNGADCMVDPDNEFNYICRCRIGYTGSFCEVQASPCIVQGIHACIMGTCVQDPDFGRGFRCECIEGFEGVNCDLSIRLDVIGFINRNYWWTYPFAMSVVLTPAIIILIMLSENRANREYKLKLWEMRQMEVARRLIRQKIIKNDQAKLDSTPAPMGSQDGDLKRKPDDNVLTPIEGSGTEKQMADSDANVKNVGKQSVESISSETEAEKPNVGSNEPNKMIVIQHKNAPHQPVATGEPNVPDGSREKSKQPIIESKPKVAKPIVRDTAKHAEKSARESEV